MPDMALAMAGLGGWLKKSPTALPAPSSHFPMSVSAGITLSLTKPIAAVTTGRNFSPMVACRFSHWAVARACFPASVSDSRAKAPCASAVCLNSKSTRA